MLRKHTHLLLVLTLLAVPPVGAEESEKPVGTTDGTTAEYPELITGKGDVYRNATVMRVETDALIVRHEGGMARVSLFDLSSELQARYDFDPIAALKRYQEDLAVQRERRKTALLESEKRRAAAVRAESERERLEIAKVEWIPVEAEVLAVSEEGALLRADRIRMVPTQVRSTLGFLKEGPPKRVLEPFSLRPILLLDPPSALRRGDRWKGYVNPLAERFVIDRGTGLPTIPAHRGASPAP